MVFTKVYNTKILFANHLKSTGHQSKYRCKPKTRNATNGYCVYFNDLFARPRSLLKAGLLKA